MGWDGRASRRGTIGMLTGVGGGWAPRSRRVPSRPAPGIDPRMAPVAVPETTPPRSSLVAPDDLWSSPFRSYIMSDG